MTDPINNNQRETYISGEIYNYFSGLPKGQIYTEEAEFGLRNITPFLEELPNGARVLEVGSGPCIVLAELAARFPELSVEGVEPMSESFSFFSEFYQRIRKSRHPVKVYLDGYESLHRDQSWDFIFLVNVFEHLSDWRHFLDFVSQSLSPKGRCVIFCPNYGFPFESHFGLPIIWNKRLTERAFRQKIQQVERENNLVGLYRSLNFVKLAEVRKVAPEKGLQLEVNSNIICEMIDRLETDPGLRSRQRFMALPALFLKRIGLIEALLGIQALHNYLPYMQITLTRRE